MRKKFTGDKDGQVNYFFIVFDNNEPTKEQHALFIKLCEIGKPSFIAWGGHKKESIEEMSNILLEK